jgi:hypothetical protein
MKSDVVYLTIDVAFIIKDVGGGLKPMFVKIRDSIRGSMAEISGFRSWMSRFGTRK